MTVLPASQVAGHQVAMRVNKPNHINPNIIQNGYNVQGSEKLGKSFGELLRNAFYDANSIEIRKDNMMKQFITNPDSINIEDLTIAMTQAELTVGFMKSVTEKVVSAYRDISNLR